MLPVGYTQLEYIEGTGRSYIDTGIIHDSTTVTRVVAEIINEQAQSPSYLFGDYSYLMGTSNGKWCGQCTITKTSGTADTQKHTFILDASGFCTIDDLRIDMMEGSSTGRKIYLFKANDRTSGANSTKRIYSVEITNRRCKYCI